MRCVSSRWPVLLAGFLSVFLGGFAPIHESHAGEVLEALKSRGALRCGVSEGIPGFSERDTTGRWQGFDVDICRAVAAAVFGDGERVEFVPLRASARFPALQARRIDLLLRNTSWTLTREAILKLQFPAILLSKEPLAPVVWSGDQEWTTLVRWVIHALILAEESGATQTNLDQVLAEGRTPLSRLSHDERALLARNLGLTPGWWATRAVKTVGNYGELFERHLGPNSPLGLERGPNRLWTQGGLLYAPSID